MKQGVIVGRICSDFSEVYEWLRPAPLIEEKLIQLQREQ